MDLNQNFYTISQLQQLLDGNVSKTTLQVMVKKGQIPSIAFMSKRLIPGEWVRSYLKCEGCKNE